MNVHTCRSGLNGTVLLGTERTTEKLSENRALGDSFGKGFYDCITEDSLACAEGDQHQTLSRTEALTPNNCPQGKASDYWEANVKYKEIPGVQNQIRISNRDKCSMPRLTKIN